jgi:hypothetical protein
MLELNGLERREDMLSIRPKVIVYCGGNVDLYMVLLHNFRATYCLANVEEKILAFHIEEYIV